MFNEYIAWIFKHDLVKLGKVANIILMLFGIFSMFFMDSGVNSIHFLYHLRHKGYRFISKNGPFIIKSKGKLRIKYEWIVCFSYGGIVVFSKCFSHVKDLLFSNRVVDNKVSFYKNKDGQRFEYLAGDAKVDIFEFFSFYSCQTSCTFSLLFFFLVQNKVRFRNQLFIFSCNQTGKK